MNKLNKIGKQLEGSTLYQRQRLVNEYTDDISVVAIDIRTPENLASIYRLADAAGCKNIVLVGDKSCLETKQFSKISRRAEKYLTIENYTHEEFIKINEIFQPLVAIEITSESKNLFETSLPEKCSFVVGNERQGINENILELCDQAIHLPMFGSMGSMNVSHALAISLFEWRRQMSLIKGSSI